MTSTPTGGTGADRPAPDDRAGSVFGADHGPSGEAEVLATAVLSVPGVAGLHGGRYGEIATYLPGRRVRGVRIEPEDPHAAAGAGRVEVHVVARYPTPVGTLASRIRTRLAPLAGDRAVDVYVEDYTVADEAPAAEPRPAPAPPGR